MSNAITFVIVIAVIAGVVYLAGKARTRAADRALTPEEKAAKMEARAAERAHTAEVRQAQGRLKTAEKAHKARVKEAEKELATLKKPAPLIRLSLSTQVTPLEVKLEGRPYPMSSQVRATIEERGERTRQLAVDGTSAKNGAVAMGAATTIGGVLVGGGATKGKAKTKVDHGVHEVDNRQILITVEGPGWGDVIEVPAAKLVDARRFVLAINNAAAQYDTFAQQHAALVAEAERAIEAAVSQTSDVDAARSALAEIEAPRP